MKYVEFLGAGMCAEGRKPTLEADIQVPLLAFTCSERENSRSQKQNLYECRG